MSNVGNIVKVTIPPWIDAIGVVESEDGAYIIIRLDTSAHPDDILELYPNEFEVIVKKFNRRKDDKCGECNHDRHDPKRCEVLYVYARGPRDAPGNQRCLCGYEFHFEQPQSNEGIWRVE